MQQSPAASTRSLVFFGSCENKSRHYKRSRDLRCITPGIVQCHLCENATLLAIKQLRKITFYQNCQKVMLINYVCNAMIVIGSFI